MSRRFAVAPSDRIAGWDWLGEEIPYTAAIGGEAVRGDTFPMTWAADGEIYTSAGDPNWGASRWGLDIERIVQAARRTTRIEQVNPMVDYVGWGGDGPKPSGMISVGGVLYFAYQNLCHMRAPFYGTKSQHGSDSVIAASRDLGRTWEPDIKKLGKGNPTFAGPRLAGPPLSTTAGTTRGRSTNGCTRSRRTSGTTAAISCSGA